jgi:4-hydroxybenzoate polyprenyltransferase
MPTFVDAPRNAPVTRAGSPSADAVAERRPLAWLWPYIEIARPDHWFKNVFMLFGVMLAYFYVASELSLLSPLTLILAFAATCLIASSNYVINEVLDAATDRSHPIKKNRPIPAGQVKLVAAYAEWILLGILGLFVASLVNLPFLISATALLIMGLAYNIPPIRTKELPYLDVISESMNNPIRLLMGWFVVFTAAIPPASLLMAYWMVGAFFMASKRFAEYRSLDCPETAASYRNSFGYYTENRLLISMFFYVSWAALLLGVFIIRYHLELILTVPLIAGFFSYYLHIALKKNSAVQHPERLYRETGLLIYLTICLFAFVGLMFVEIPSLYPLFNVEPSRLPALWRLDG